MTRSSLGKLLAAIAVSELAGVLGSIFTASSVREWYVTLTKAPLTPPSWVFGPVWTTLFALMGIAAFLVWQQGLKRNDVRVALRLFIGQLALNLLWSILFFGARSPGAALIEIIVLWMAILATILAFKNISKPAAWLLVPYLLWVTFATYLNASIWILNR